MQKVIRVGDRLLLNRGQTADTLVVINFQDLPSQVVIDRELTES